MIVRRQYRGGYQFAGLAELARELRKRQTSAEGLLWQLLRNRQLLGFKFRRQHQFADYVADFYCHEAQLAIECDGSVHEPNEQWYHDQNRDAYMTAQGLRVLRFANDRILNDTEEVLEEIAKHLPSPIGRREGKRGVAEVGSTSKPSPRPSPKGRGRKQQDRNHSRWIRNHSIF